jgi:hypothetical protein
MNLMGSAMVIFAQAVKQLGGQDLPTLAKGIGSIAVILAAIAGFTQIVNPAKLMGVSVAMNAIGSALLIMTQSVKQLGGLDLAVLAKGLGSIAVLLAALAGFTRIVKPNKLVSVSIALNAIGAALLILAKSDKELGGQDLETLVKGLGAIAVLLAAIAGFTQIVKAEKILAVSAAMVIMGAGLLIMAQVIKTLGAMPIDQIIIGLVALAGVFAVLGLAALVLQPLVPTILGLAIAVGILGVGIALVGAGVLAFSAGLTALSLGATAAAGAIVIIGNAVLSLIPILFEKLGEGIVELGKVIINGAPIIAEAIIVLVQATLDTLKGTLPDILDTVFELLIMLLDKLNENIGPIIEKVATLIINIFDALGKYVPEIVQAGLKMLLEIFQGIFSGIDNFTMDDVLKLSAAIGALVACFLILKAAKMSIKDALIVAGEMLVIFGILTTAFLILANVGADKVLDIAIGLSATLLALSAAMVILALIPIPAALTAVAGLGIFVGGLTVILAALGALNQIPGFEWLIGEGAKVMGMLGAAIGDFVGNIIGHFMTGVSASFEQIGKDLSAFMVAVTPFIEGTKNIDSASMEGVKALAETVLILTAAGVLDGLTKWLTGGSSMVKFGEEIAAFAPYFVDYYNQIKDVDGSVVEASANASLALAKFANNLPKEGGLWQDIVGTGNLTKFAEELVSFGPALMEYSKSVTGLDGGVVEASANAALALAELANNLPKHGGFWQDIIGDSSLTSFAEELAQFGPAMMKYAESVTGLDAAVVINSANAAMALAELANNLPNQGGAKDWFTGDNRLSLFGEEVAKFGPYLKSYAESVSGLDANVVTNSANAAKALAELSNNLPNSGGLVSLFTGDNNIADFGWDVAEFGRAFGTYYEYIKGISLPHMQGVIDGVKLLLKGENVRGANISGYKPLLT